MPLVEMTEEEIARRYNLANGLVAIDFDLASDLAKCDGGIASHLLVYDAGRHRYVRKLELAA